GGSWTSPRTSVAELEAVLLRSGPVDGDPGGLVDGHRPACRWTHDEPMDNCEHAASRAAADGHRPTRGESGTSRWAPVRCRLAGNSSGTSAGANGIPRMPSRRESSTRPQQAG